MAGPVLVALCGFLLTLYLFHPGFMSFDSSVQFAQVLSGRVENSHPPIMVHLWRLTNRVVYGPAGMLAVHAAAWWTGIALVAASVASRVRTRVLATLCLGLWPPLFALVPTVWKDVGALCAFVLATGLVLHGRRLGSRLALVASLPVAFYGAAVRFNAFPAALPLVLLAVDGWPRRPDPGPRRPITRQPGRLLAIVALALTMLAGTCAVNHVGVRRVPIRAAVPLWDLAVLSLETGRMLVPEPAILNPRLDLARLAKMVRRHRLDYPPLPDSPGGRVELGWKHLAPEEANRITLAWLGAIVRHPREYLAHRAHVTAKLVREPDLPYFHGYRAGAGFSPRAAGIRLRVRPGLLAVERLLAWLSAGPLFRPWPYLLLGAVTWLAGRRLVDGPAARCLLASGGLAVAPLPLLAPATDFRYWAWPIAASLVAAALVVPAHVPGRPRASSPGISGI